MDPVRTQNKLMHKKALNKGEAVIQVGSALGP